MKVFAHYVRRKLRAIGKSQKSLAKELGVSAAYISQILTGKRNPPDLGRFKNRMLLKTWAQFLDVDEAEMVDLIQHELHKVPLPPRPRFPQMRELLLARLGPTREALSQEMRAFELHPAENRAIEAMSQMYLALHDDGFEHRAHAAARFKELMSRVRSDRDFIEHELKDFFSSQPFSWAWDFELNAARIEAGSGELIDAQEKARRLLSGTHGQGPVVTVPVVGHVSAGEGFEFTDGGFHAGEGFEQVSLPPGISSDLASVLYCVCVRGNSLKEFFGEGTLLFIKPESWEEIKDGDLVIFKDRDHGRAFVKKIEFAGNSLILKSMNALYNNMVIEKSDLILLERVVALVF